MSSKFAPESLLALRQVVDEKLTTQDIEHILEAIQISEKENLAKELVENCPFKWIKRTYRASDLFDVFTSDHSKGFRSIIETDYGKGNYR